MAINQDHLIVNDRFYREIAALTGQRRELRKRGKPHKRDEQTSRGDDRCRMGERPH
jgi:putative transposase